MLKHFRHATYRSQIARTPRTVLPHKEPHGAVPLAYLDLINKDLARRQAKSTNRDLFLYDLQSF